MADQTFNDNDAQPSGPDAYGQAALLLVESLIHGLIARSVIDVADAVEIVAVAEDVKEDVAAELGDSPTTMRHSLTLLAAIRRTLSIDLPDDGPTIHPVQ